MGTGFRTKMGTVKGGESPRHLTAGSQVECLSCGVAVGWCCSITSGFAVAFLSVLGMALTTGTDLLGEIDGSKVEAANRCYYAAAVYGIFFVASIMAVMFGADNDIAVRKLEM